MKTYVDGSADGRFERIRPSPAYMRVAELIEHEIVAGRIQPGEPIGTEAALADQFGVTRSTIREGIRLLEQSGLIRRDRSRRLYASVPRLDKLATRLTRALQLNRATFQEVWEAAMVLEPASAEAAAGRVADEHLARLDENLTRTRAALGDVDRIAALDTEFHTLVAAASSNRVLQLAREPIALLFHSTLRAIIFKVPVAESRNLKAHEWIVDALRRRHPEDARMSMRKHIVDWRRGYVITGESLDEPLAGDDL